MPNRRLVHIVDGDPSVRRSVAHLLQRAEFETASYDSPLAVIDAAPALTEGCMLIDVCMPGMDGIELHRTLLAAGVYLPVVMTGHGDVATVVKAIKEGAIDFVQKPFADERLLSAIEVAVAAKPDSDKTSEVTAAIRKIGSLSPRESQVLKAMAAGQANKTIAYDLGISVRTVEVHRARMLERLGTKRPAEAIRLWVLAIIS
jgi:two-component system response regulator FixJ